MQELSVANRSARPGPWLRRGRLLAELALLIGLAYLIARTFWFIIFGASAQNFALEAADREVSRSPSGYSADLSRLAATALFTDRRSGEVEVIEQTFVPETSLNLELKGLRRGSSPSEGAAIILTPDNLQGFYSAGETIMDGVELLEVHVDHVIIRRRGVTESLYLRDREGNSTAPTARSPQIPPAQAVASRPPGVGAIPPQQRGIMGMLGPVAEYENNILVGYRFSQGNPAFLQAMNLNPNDLVTAINGVELSRISSLEDFLEEATESDTLTISLVRNSTNMTLEVDLP
ncbi:type II secretion system protein N [Maricaulis sp. D1M11]|uniref:type II secretion system protein N n=1 Tax=Maricaulis sp. D1M11 TaxID=3076117 RepID=UPI0039B673E3